MRVLIDACLPVQFKKHLPFPGVTTARELGWQNKQNGELLAVAQHQFDVLLTMDKRMPSQQFLSQFSIGLLIIRAPSNRLADLLPLVPAIVRMVPRVRKGQALAVPP
jgi:predicted nuclease of predicted toxin-antitoxin system